MDNKYCTCGKYYHPTEFDKGLYPKCDMESNTAWLCDNVDNTIYEKFYGFILKGDKEFHKNVQDFIDSLNTKI